MANIVLLDKNTINKIAAGEVVERPASVVKELIENAIDAGASAITAEIKEGGISFIRITDNGTGIEKEDLKVAFLRHATSKIRSVEDLLTIGSLGFRGEALSSIASVAMVEVVTKTRSSFTGSRYCINGGEEIEFSDVGAPEGTTFIVRNLFYNTPARRKFLKSPSTEAGYISDLLERLSVSHPDVSFKFINNNKTMLHTSGNRNLKDIIYHVYGREIAGQLLPVANQNEYLTLEGYVGKPVVSRGNRNYENYFINGRYIKSTMITKALEEAYRPYSMQHKYPFTAIHFTIDPSIIDVNVHPTKMEIRFTDAQMVYKMTYHAISSALAHKNMILEVGLSEEKKEIKQAYESIPEPFESNRISMSRERIKEEAQKKRNEAILSMQSSSLFEKNEKEVENKKTIPAFIKDTEIAKLYEVARKPQESLQRLSEANVNVESKENSGTKERVETNEDFEAKENLESKENFESKESLDTKDGININEKLEYDKRQETYLEEKKTSLTYGQDEIIAKNPKSVLKESVGYDTLLAKEPTQQSTQQPTQQLSFLTTEDIKLEYRIIGQLFATYWLLEVEKQLYIIDQHAAHEKILYEATLKRRSEKEFLSQMVSPPIILTLSLKEQEAMKEHKETLEMLGFDIRPFGGKEYVVSALPADMYGIKGEELLIEFLDDLVEEAPKGTPDVIFEKIASLSCKAAVKGNSKMSVIEAQSLIEQLMQLDNPFHCPHGRPIIVSMTKYEIEKKFKRII